MALGGGSFVTTNKALPGAYVNFVSASKASATLAERGVVALPVELNWGRDNNVFEISKEDFQKNSIKILGYSYDAEQLKGFRDMFKHIKKACLYKLMNGGTKASNKFCEAKYKGTRGNDIKTVITINADDSAKVDVSTYLDTLLVDVQTVAPSTNNLEDNAYVLWKKDVVLNATAGLTLASGSNGKALTGSDYQKALNAFESHQFNALGCLSTTPEIIDLFSAFTKRFRDELGIKFQTVVYRGKKADYEGVISVENNVLDDNARASALVFWTVGAQASCQVNKSLSNRIYDGEFAVNTAYRQSELEAHIAAGKFAFHKVGNEVRVLRDINTFIGFTVDKSSDFSSNQTIRVLDQVASDIAVLFNDKYNGKVSNDADGRISLWNDIVSHHQQLQSIRAIEGFESDAIQVRMGIDKKSVVVEDVIMPINAMEQLYMTVIVQ